LFRGNNNARNSKILLNYHQVIFQRPAAAAQHVVYGEYNALFDIETLDMIEGDLPNRAKKLVIEWATRYQTELLEMWTTQPFHKLPPLE
jgi:hypothetical protein